MLVQNPFQGLCRQFCAEQDAWIWHYGTQDSKFAA